MNKPSHDARAKVSGLFAKTKRMCFGRYAIELPEDAEQVFGFENIDAGFERFPRSKYPEPALLLESEWKKALLRNRTAARISPNQSGPVPGAKYFWFYWNKGATRDDSRLLDGAIPIGSNLYLYKGMSDRYERITNEEVFLRMTALMRGMRAWDGVSVPREPGVCIEGAFIEEPTHRFQEIMSSGFYFPSLPDVSFSILSNKNASVEGDNGKGLLERVDEARREQPIYPYAILRRGKRTLHGLWDGEEVLTRRSDGALLFDWEMVGQPGNPARPSWFEMGFRTRVANNRVGDAPTSSLTDEQAVALWDRLLENVKFRVAVPGATPQSVARL